jgi:NAD(P)-dependent dehydrogenase (short-subunit alcohol dehydrogenase family)
MHIDPSRLFDLSGRTAVVTGGAGALGSQAAMALASAGAQVAVVDVDDVRVAQAVAAIQEDQGTAPVGLVGDLTDEAEVERVFETVMDSLGGVDILVNAIAAPVPRAAPEVFPLNDWQTTLASDLTSFFLCSRAAATRMIAARRGGSIVNFSSIAGLTALGRGNMAYAVAKGGICQLTREMAFAWAPENIRVNAILPCQFTNAWWAQIVTGGEHEPLVERVLSGIPLGRLGAPSEIRGPVVFLASDAASMVTGIMLPVDGGNLAANAGASLTM